MKKDIEIRNAEEKDIPRITELLIQVHKVHSDKRPDLFRRGSKKYDEEELKQIISDSNRPIFVGVDENDKVLGYVFCNFRHFGDKSLEDYDSVYVDDFCVDEKYRKKGVGTALYDYVVKFAKKKGCHNLTLNVWSPNEDAVIFYSRMGLTVQKYVMEQIL